LPEGSKILEVSTGKITPNSISKTEKTFSYLDFLGRPTVVVTFKNHIPQVVLGENLKIRYSISKSKLLIEPAYLVCGLMGMFMFTIVVSKLNLDFVDKSN